MTSKWKWVALIVGCLGFGVLMLYGRLLVYTKTTTLPKQTAQPTHAVPPQTSITLLYHERKPYYVTGDDGVFGLCADPVKKAFREAGIVYSWLRIPASRQLEMVKRDEKPLCAVGWFKNPEREQFGKFTASIYQDKPMLAMIRADNQRVRSGMTVEQVMRDRGLRLLRKESYSYGEFIDESISEFEPRVVTTTADNVGMLKMILTHRADYMFVAEEEAQELITKMGMVPGKLKEVRLVDMPPGNKRYLLCSQSVENRIVDLFNAVIWRQRPASD